MTKSQDPSSKYEKEKKKQQKREEKQKRKEARKANSKKGEGFDSMISYVDAHGFPSDAPPEKSEYDEIEAEDIDIGTSKKQSNTDRKKVKKEEEDFSSKGKVVFFNTQKGYGFINNQANDERIFVHVSGLVDEIKENDLVTFELKKGPKGMNAVNVKKI